MNFNCSRQNSRLTARLESLVKDGRVSHAYIFESSSAVDKAAFARSFVKGVLCPKSLGENCGRCSICDKVDHDNHEDVTWISREGRSVKDAAVISLQEKLNIKPMGDRNVVVICDCDTMTSRAQNRLLKTLEEPPGSALIILLSENMDNLAQTVLSRCVKFRIEGSDNNPSAAKAEKVVEMAFKGEPFYRICRECEDYLKNGDKAQELLDSIEQVYASLINEKSRNIPIYTFDNVYRNIREIEKARKLIFQGMSAGYAIKDMLLKITD